MLGWSLPTTQAPGKSRSSGTPPPVCCLPSAFRQRAWGNGRPRFFPDTLLPRDAVCCPSYGPRRACIPLIGAARKPLQNGVLDCRPADADRHPHSAPRAPAHGEDSKTRLDCAGTRTLQGHRRRLELRQPGRPLCSRSRRLPHFGGDDGWGWVRASPLARPGSPVPDVCGPALPLAHTAFPGPATRAMHGGRDAGPGIPAFGDSTAAREWNSLTLAYAWTVVAVVASKQGYRFQVQGPPITLVNGAARRRLRSSGVLAIGHRSFCRGQGELSSRPSSRLGRTVPRARRKGSNLH